MHLIRMPVRKAKHLVLIISVGVVLWLSATVLYKHLHKQYGNNLSPFGCYRDVLMNALFSFPADLPTSLVANSSSRANRKPLEFLMKEQIQRKSLIDSVCRLADEDVSGDLKETETLDHIIVDDEHKLLYCYVPKVREIGLVPCVDGNECNDSVCRLSLIIAGGLHQLETDFDGSDG